MSICDCNMCRVGRGAHPFYDGNHNVCTKPVAEPASTGEPPQGYNVLQDGPVNRLHEALAAAYKWNDSRRAARPSEPSGFEGIPNGIANTLPGPEPAAPQTSAELDPLPPHIEYNLSQIKRISDVAAPQPVSGAAPTQPKESMEDWWRQQYLDLLAFMKHKQTGDALPVEEVARKYAKNDGLWTTQETVEANLKAFANDLLPYFPPGGAGVEGVWLLECDWHDGQGFQPFGECFYDSAEEANAATLNFKIPNDYRAVKYGPLASQLLVRCHTCKSTLIYKRLGDNEIDVYHTCNPLAANPASTARTHNALTLAKKCLWKITLHAPGYDWNGDSLSLTLDIGKASQAIDAALNDNAPNLGTLAAPGSVPQAEPPKEEKP